LEAKEFYRFDLRAEHDAGNSLSPLPKDATISYQAGQRCSQRPPVRAFEPGAVFGTTVETIKKLF